MPITEIFHVLSIFCAVLALVMVVLQFMNPSEQGSMVIGFLLSFAATCWLSAQGITNYVVIPTLLVLLVLLPLCTHWVERLLRK